MSVDVRSAYYEPKEVSLEHPWAGRRVKWVAEVLVVRLATPEELESGEPIGPESVRAD